MSLRVPFIFLFIAALTNTLTPAKQTDKVRSQSAPQAAAEDAEPNDPLGRSTPHGTVFGFLQTAQSAKYKEATQYLQLSKKERATEGERLARQLHDLMDSAFVGRVGRISDRREGSVQVGVPPDHERIGVFRLSGSETDVDLVRVSDPSAGDIWLFSSKTLAAVPDLFAQIETNQIESELPRFLVTDRFLHTPLWRLMVFVLLIPVSFAVAWGMVKLLGGGQRLWLRWRGRRVPEGGRGSLAAPATLVLTVVFHQIGVRLLGVALLIQVYYQRFASVVLIAGAGWLVFRLINRWGERARVMALAGSEDRSAIVLLGQRILKAVVAIIAALVMLSILGFDMTTALAGLGIGSIAIAFAAQKTLENLLGGVSILSDEVIRVGELCRIGDTEGAIEDISLRSTRIRTLDRTELSVPNGQLASMNVVNLSRRDKHLFRTKIALRCETSPDQLQALLTEMEALLRRHPKVDPNVARVRLMGFGESSLDVEINCHVLTSDWNEFLAIRQGLLLQIMTLVTDSGTEFAFPSRTVYLAHDQGWDPQLMRSLEKNGSAPRNHR